jgi:hypothetical protein
VDQGTDWLPQHSIALGNQKPSILQNVEIRLWRMVLSLAAGQPLDQELQKFMSSVGMLLKLEKDSMEPHWFIGGMMTMTRPVTSNLITH